jgi:secreted trypsin-like serine protease
MGFLKLLVIFMTLSGLARVELWDKYNSSLLIEVIRSSGVFTCTGVAVSSKLILTAAHCLEGPVKRVRVFTQDRYDPEEFSMAIKDYELHPLYDSRSSLYVSDLAKLSLVEPLPPTIKIHSIHGDKKIFGRLLRFGFGQRDGYNIRTLTTPSLKKVNPDEEVVELFDEYSRSGDSGGPVFLENGDKVTLLAIHSTFSHGPQGNYSLNPLLAPHLSWIFSH